MKVSPVRKGVRRATALCLLVTQGAMACAAAAPPPPSEFLTPTSESEFELKRGDVLRIDVWRQPEFSGEFMISADGALVHPLYREVQVAGLTPSAARERLSEFLGIYLQGPRLVLEPLSSVTVAGEVRRPNVYHLARGTTVAEAIGQAGGPTAEAELGKVRLVREGAEYQLSLSEELTTYGSVEVLSGDQIYLNRQSDVNIWRDIVAPVSTLAALVLTIVRISDRTNN